MYRFVVNYCCIVLVIVCGRPQALLGMEQSSPCALVNANGQPSQELLTLLTLTHITHDGSLHSIIKETQKPQGNGGWLRPSHLDYNDLIDAPMPNNVENSVHALGVVGNVIPTKKGYDYAVIAGATYGSMRKRLAYLKYVYQNYGVTFAKIVFLVSERPRDITRETEQKIVETDNDVLPFREELKDRVSSILPKTERELAHYLFAFSDVPDDWHTLRIPTYISAPLRKKSDGTLCRPNTDDTVYEWLAYNPLPGTILLITSQSFVARQTCVLQRILPNTFTVEGVGHALKNYSHKYPLVLDALARTLHEFGTKYLDTQ